MDLLQFAQWLVANPQQVKVLEQWLEESNPLPILWRCCPWANSSWVVRSEGTLTTLMRWLR
jgi:hypothetical protein